MRYLYIVGIYLFRFLISISAFFNPKAKLWIRGRSNWEQKLKQIFPVNEPVTWFHAASLGEFEQGKPLIEKIRQQHPQHKILLTFFSPSGYEIRKNYTGVDYVVYLPLDTPLNAKRFIDLVRPSRVFFIKYEFWYYFLKQLHSKHIPLYLISGIFRKNQVFFKWYGKWYRNMLHFFAHIFVQQQESLTLLKNAGISHASISGDNRFDTVSKAAASVQPIESVSRFILNAPCLIAGSTWPEDESILISMLYESDYPFKLIMAPHEIHPGHIRKITSQLKDDYILFSQITSVRDISNKKVLIIDNIGMLLSVYQYATVAYVGGGFGKGIHNILEPAAFGAPVIFGPRYKKFREAVELIDSGGAFTINKTGELTRIVNRLFTDQPFYTLSAGIVKEYITSNTGATQTVIDHVSQRDYTAAD